MTDWFSKHGQNKFNLIWSRFHHILQFSRHFPYFFLKNLSMIVSNFRNSEKFPRALLGCSRDFSCLGSATYFWPAFFLFFFNHLAELEANIEAASYDPTSYFFYHLAFISTFIVQELCDLDLHVFSRALIPLFKLHVSRRSSLSAVLLASSSVEGWLSRAGPK